MKKDKNRKYIIIAIIFAILFIFLPMPYLLKAECPQYSGSQYSIWGHRLLDCPFKPNFFWTSFGRTILTFELTPAGFRIGGGAGLPPGLTPIFGANILLFMIESILNLVALGLISYFIYRGAKKLKTKYINKKFMKKQFPKFKNIALKVKKNKKYVLMLSIPLILAFLVLYLYMQPFSMENLFYLIILVIIGGILWAFSPYYHIFFKETKKVGYLSITLKDLLVIIPIILIAILIWHITLPGWTRPHIIAGIYFLILVSIVTVLVITILHKLLRRKSK